MLQAQNIIPETVSDEVIKQYSRTLGNWTYLSGYLSMHDPDKETIGILMYIELHSHNRLHILNRLLSRYISSLRKEAMHAITDLSRQVYIKKHCKAAPKPEPVEEEAHEPVKPKRVRNRKASSGHSSEEQRSVLETDTSA